jgi:hypothetical protein
MNDFDGKTYNPERDRSRLSVQLYRVKAVMGDGQWRTLEMIARAIRAPEASISARLRDFRKARNGNHVVERRFVRKGLWEYRLVVSDAKAA